MDAKEIRINPKIVIDMVEKYKLPSKSKIPGATAEAFTIEETLKSLANNKHNDHTTTYYLLHKKWVQEYSSKKEGADVES